MFRSAAAVGLALALGFSSAAHAGVYGDDLAKCLVKSAGPADQKDFVIWAFAAMSAHPDVQSYATFTDAQRADMTKRVAKLYERLMTVDCRAETIAAMKYEGFPAIEQGFSLLGQVAFRGLMGNPKVAQTFSDLPKYVDIKSFEALGVEAGVKPAPGKTAK
jgi:hypothetical protein